MYDAFISYSHAADGQLAPAVQRALHRLTRPWYKVRALRVFRDKTSLAVTPQVWPSIERAMAESRYLVLLASPQAAASLWVDHEVRWWLTYRSPETLLIVLTEGSLSWSQGGTDRRRTTVDAAGLCAGATVGRPTVRPRRAPARAAPRRVPRGHGDAVSPAAWPPP